MFDQQLVNGIVLGSVYSLIAVGFSLVFSILEIINFSHGSLLMMGVFVSLALGLALPGLGFFGVAIVTVLIIAVVGIGVERVAVAPLRDKGAHRALALVSTLGAAIMLEALAQLIWGADVRPYPLTLPKGYFEVGSARVTYTELTIVLLSASLMIGLQLLVRYARWGRAIRAAAQNPTAAALMGIDINQTVRRVFAIGSALAAVAGMLMGVYYNYAHPSMGFAPDIKGFVAAVLGGMGSVLGAGLGGILLGVAEVFGGSYISFAYRDAIAFGILIIIFLVRPQGILGTLNQDKV
jgi:branched-chain amino acid transport system permease protein